MAPALPTASILGTLIGDNANLVFSASLKANSIQYSGSDFLLIAAVNGLH